MAIFLLTTLRVYIHRRIIARFRAGRSPAGLAHGLVFLPHLQWLGVGQLVVGRARTGA